MLDPLLARMGVHSTSQLADLGLDRARRDRAVEAGGLVRVRTGWYARSDADARVVSAVRAEGCVSCASALRLHGVWVPESMGVDHVRHARHRREQGRRGCRPHGAIPPVRAAVDDVETAFRCALRCGSAEDVIVIADSLLHLRIATRDELASWMTDAPRSIAALLDATGVAESGTESMTRVRLRGHRIGVRTQVWIGPWRVDLIVGDRLVIECDSREHHGSWSTHAADRARDRALVAAGYRVMRVTYHQVVDEWSAVEQDILTVVRRGEHRWPRHRDAH